MTDELDRLRKELRSAEPRVVARAKGMNAAMLAFDQEFSEASSAATAESVDHAVDTADAGKPDLAAPKKTEKNISAYQGSDAHRRLSGQNAPRGGTRPRRRSMTSRIPTFSMMFGGTAVAAALAAFVVLPNIKGELNTSYADRSRCGGSAEHACCC